MGRGHLHHWISCPVHVEAAWFRLVMKPLISHSALRRIARPVALFAAAGFLLAACGSDSTAGKTQPSSGAAAAGGTRAGRRLYSLGPFFIAVAMP